MKDGKLLVACLGLGAAGSNMAESALVVGLTEKVFVLNSSSEDLDSLQMIEKESKWKFGGISGAAKDRNIAFEAFKSEHQKFLTAFESRIMDNDGDKLDIVFVFASAGGGTGSGIAPIASRILRQKYPTLKVIPVLALPSMQERGIAQQNALDCLSDLIKGEFCTIVVDNTRVNNNSIMGKYDEINKETCENIKNLVSFKKVSRISNIDVADRLSMFNDPGLLVIGTSLVDPEEPSPMRAAAKSAIDSTPMTADIAGSVRRVAVQCEMSAELYTEENRFDLQDRFKNAAGIFEGYYTPEEVDNVPINRILIAFSGANLSKSNVREREMLVETQFKADEHPEVRFGSGNTGLKTAWGSTSKQPVKDTDSFDSLFDELS